MENKKDEYKKIVYGKWLFPFESTTMICECSVCRTWKGNKNYNWCPMCGAYMKGEKNEK